MSAMRSTRCREELFIYWMNYPYYMSEVKIWTVVIVVSLFTASCVAQDFPLGATDPRVENAIDYIAESQNSDGGFGAGASSLSTTRLAIEAIASTGGSPLMYQTEGKTVEDYLLSVSEDVYSGTQGANAVTEKINMLLSLSACGLDAQDFGEHDHVESLFDEQNSSTGCFGGGASDTAYAIIALKAAGVEPTHERLDNALQCLLSMQLADGGFEYSSGSGADSNTVAIATRAMIMMEYSGGALDQAFDALAAFQNTTNGGFFYQAMWGTDPDVSSTSTVVGSIYLNGQDPREDPWSSGDANPIGYLLDMQRETGEFEDPWDPFRPTCLAVSSLSGNPLPGVKVISEGGILVTVIGALALLVKVDGVRR